MKKLFLTMCCFVAWLPSVSMAAGPGSGTESKYDVRIGRCNADKVTVKYNLDSLMGEPTINGSLKWKGDDDCRLPSSTVIWLRVVDGGTGEAWVRIAPVTPRANSGYGYNVTGSPSWRKTLCGFHGTESQSCLSSREAKDLWKHGYVDGFDVEWDR